jgi:hypothetical protein
VVLSNPIFSSTGRVNSKVPYSGCKAEEALLPAPLAARVSDPKGISNERRICVHYLWSGVTILNLLFPISPFFAFGYYRLARLGPTLDLFSNNQGGVHSIKSFMPAQTHSLFLERNECREQLFPLVLESYQSPLLPLASVLHQMMSPCENFLFYWRPAIRLSRKLTNA